MNQTLSYVILLGVYGLTDIIGILGLNLQYGYAGVGNFAFIVYVAVGGYAYALLTLGPPSANGGFQHYFAGTSLPFPLPFLLAGVVGCGVGAVTGIQLLRRLRPDFQYVVFFALAFVASGVASSAVALLNGSAGLSLIPAPLANSLGLTALSTTYGFVYIGICLVFALASLWLVQRLTRSPWGRLLRAGRDRELACRALGKVPGRERYIAFVLGAGLAAISGALLVAFTSAWSPASWTAPETIVFFTALIVGGAGNNWGAMLGALIVQVVIGQAPLYLPNFASATVIAALQWIIIGGLTLLFIWFRPVGLIPARPRRYPEPDAALSGIPADARANAAHIAREPSGEITALRQQREALARGGGRGAAPHTIASLAWTLGRYPKQRDGVAAVAVRDQPGTSRRDDAPAVEDSQVSDRPAGVLGSPDEASAVLAAVGLSKNFGGVAAVKDVDVAVAAGRVTGLMGPNGAGKSTLVSMLAGEEKPTTGRIVLNGADVTSRPASWMGRHGVVRTFQLSTEFASLSVLENLLVACPRNPGERPWRAIAARRSWIGYEAEGLDRAWRLMQEFGLSRLANETAAKLSGGQRRLVEFMRAIMAEPMVLILDEPLAGVARGVGEVMISHFAALRDRGIAVVLVEHELDVLHRVADTVVVMARGAKIAEGAMTEVVELAAVKGAYVAG